MAVTRVYILAKELEVSSAAIIKKCEDEDIPNIKNHMSVISAGLAATIREWFSEGDNVTTVETGEKVNLDKVRIKKKKKVAEEKPEEPVEVQPEPQVEEPVQPEPQPEIKQPQPEVVKPVEPQVVVPEPQPVVEPVKPVAKPAKPKLIVPAGPMLSKPEPAKLSGPTVVRVEAPEPERQRGPARGPALRKPPRRDFTAEPAVKEPFAAGPTAEKEHAGKKKHKEKAHGKKDEFESEETKRAKYDFQRRQRDIEERRVRLNAASGAGMRVRPVRKITDKSHKDGTAPVIAAAAAPTQASISEPIQVKDLSAVLAVKASDIIYKLMKQGVMATANQVISPDVAELIAIDYGCELTIQRKATLEEQIAKEFEVRDRNNLQKRSVIATMLGHVDHGKTSLLDKIRSSKVAQGEAGGITQHVNAYQVTHGDKKVTFIDTPGHAAFTAMRARGATMTDVVVLVVAADDGVMPQTIEVINHAKAANVQVIVALNKCDLPGYDINRIYAQLAEHDLTPVEWGGKTEVVKTSAITGEGIDDLLEHLEYVADLLDLKADDTIPATGWVVEAEMNSKEGVVATMLLKEGKLSKGDVLMAGGAYGRVKTMRNSFGKVIKEATSAMPVEITGLDEVPQAGDKFYCMGADLSRAKTAAEENKVSSREIALAKRTQVTMENLFSQIEAGSVKDLNIIIRADVDGSIEVLKKYLSDLSTQEIKIKILHASTGGITEGDVALAEASNGIIIGFNVVAEDQVAKIAESKGVEIKLYTIIYRITEDLEKSMLGMLEPEEKEQKIGRAVVRDIFKVSKVGTIAGCFVTEGLVKNNAKCRLIRGNVVVRDDLSLDSLKHFKNDVREVKAGLECGLKIAKFDDIKIDDIFDFYETVKVARKLR